MDKITIWNNEDGYVAKDFTSISIEESNMSDGNRIAYIAQIAPVVRLKENSKNPRKLFDRLLKEAAPNDPNDTNNASRVLEFIPVVTTVQVLNNNVNITCRDGRIATVPIEKYLNDIVSFSYVKNIDNRTFKLYTNYRALYNVLKDPLLIPLNDPEELKDYVLIKLKIPMFVWAQLYTHQTLTKVSQSDRMGVYDPMDFWLPEDIEDRVREYMDKLLSNKGFDPRLLRTNQEVNRKNIKMDLLTGYSQLELYEFFKELGYNHEIYQRAIYYFRYKTFIMGGWKNDPKRWQHLILERYRYPSPDKNHTQKETKKVVEAIGKLISI